MILVRFLQAEQIVPTGSISPNAIHVQSIYVDRIVPATSQKRVDIPPALKNPLPQAINNSPENSLRHRIAKRAAKEIKNGYYVNLGIGMPTLVPEYLEPGAQVWLQSENGILGMGPYPAKDEIDP